MPRLVRWIVASRMLEVLDKETLRSVLDLGGRIGGGWCLVHQHICVNPENKERIERLLRDSGYTVSEAKEFRRLEQERHEHE